VADYNIVYFVSLSSKIIFRIELHTFQEIFFSQKKTQTQGSKLSEAQLILENITHQIVYREEIL
jgi:hypothetical protein